MKKRIIVLMGGPSSEHEVSLNTGKEIIKNLDKDKYDVSSIVIPKKGGWLFPQTKMKGAVAFIAMHGEFGEDGTIQGLLESFGIPYTGSGILASALGMDKPRQAALFRQAGLHVPEFAVIHKSEWRKNKNRTLYDIRKNFSMPLVVKPANRGSSVGVSIVRPGLTKRRPGLTSLSAALNSAFLYSNTAMVQEYIRGREITCGVLEGEKEELVPLTPTEILAKAGVFYDYKSKYARGGSEHILPPRNISQKKLKKIQDATCLAHNVLGCRGLSRTDFILGHDQKLYVLEINTLPGMTSTSLLPEAAKSVGIEFPKLLDLIIRSAVSKSRSG